MSDRKRVLIIGNGFDLDLGRKTLYKHFYESQYCPKDYPAPLIQHLNGKWKDNLEAVKWYDLENELSNYYSYIESKKFKVDVFSESEKHWIDKFKTQDFLTPLLNIKDEKNKSIVRNLKERGIFKNTLDSAYTSLSTRDLFLPPNERDFIALQKIKEGLKEYLYSEQRNNSINEKSVAAAVAKAFVSDHTSVEKIIYSFNYTNLRDDFYAPILKDDFFTAILHVHGDIKNDNLILGTKDDEFDEKYDFLQKAFDTKYNPPAMVYDLMKADDIIIFGHSLGMNDSQYFKAFFERQSSTQNPEKKNIIIFTKDEKSEFAIKRSLRLMTDNNLTSLYGLNRLTIIKTDELYMDRNKLRKVINNLFDYLI